MDDDDLFTESSGSSDSLLSDDDGESVPGNEAPIRKSDTRHASITSQANTRLKESKVHPVESLTAEQSTAKTAEVDRGGLPQDFFEAPKREPSAAPSAIPFKQPWSAGSPVANPHRTTVADACEEDTDEYSEQDWPERTEKPVERVAHTRPAHSEVSQGQARVTQTEEAMPAVQAFEQKYQPVIVKNTIGDKSTNTLLPGLRYPSSDLVMPLLPESPIERHTLGCSSVTNALRNCRGSSVYKGLRNLVWRFHLDLEDLNKRRQYHWLPLAEHCRVLMARMITDLRKEYVFKDRWRRQRYKQFLGNEDGSQPGTIFYMFKVSIPWMRLGCRYAFEAQRELQNVSTSASFSHVEPIRER